MSDASEEDSSDELEQIREQKRKELLEAHAGDGNSENSDNSAKQRFDSPVEIRDSGHLDELLASESPVLVDCFADWCGPCQMMEPVIESLAAETSAVVTKVDVDTHQSLAGELGVQGVPTLVLFVDGEPVERLVGAKDRNTLETLIQRYT